MVFFFTNIQYLSTVAASFKNVSHDISPSRRETFMVWSHVGNTIALGPLASTTRLSTQKGSRKLEGHRLFASIEMLKLERRTWENEYSGKNLRVLHRKRDEHGERRARTKSIVPSETLFATHATFSLVTDQMKFIINNVTSLNILV